VDLSSEGKPTTHKRVGTTNRRVVPGRRRKQWWDTNYFPGRTGVLGEW